MPALLDFPQYVERTEPIRQRYRRRGNTAFHEQADYLFRHLDSHIEEMLYLRDTLADRSMHENRQAVKELTEQLLSGLGE
ncbi:hypothetical protein GOP56_20025 [Brevibacillus sp. 7WMA2]|uniref:hypothetical protein n=1 Tax=Brevibacillus sp. 7WMA2 TaxID=2683193 RepID=UPI0013A7906C|nr:hypothetical protein [Brevibacillus sp. 7WMA2]QIC07655.1 hypothetical protein GOP56_20025 [Brevibacillus sp. 7WMA2]